MRPIKALTANIATIPDIELHILVTQEDGVIVARCLDFSVSSHGDDEQDALASLSESIVDYLDYAVQQEAFQEIIDPDEESLWKLFQTLKFQQEIESIKKHSSNFSFLTTSELSYA